MLGTKVGEVAAEISVILACVGAVGRMILWPIIRFFRRMGSAISYVEGEMRNNGGGTLRDGQDRIEQRLAYIDEALGIKTPIHLLPPEKGKPQ